MVNIKTDILDTILQVTLSIFVPVIKMAKKEAAEELSHASEQHTGCWMNHLNFMI